MTDHESFLASIIANPDDDAPRLIYADWLEEHGEAERAEFIRVQCELAGGKYVKHADACRCRECGWRLRKRENELLQSGNGKSRFTNRCNWFEPFRRCCQITQEDYGWTFRRGFVDTIQIYWRDWVQHHDAILKATPLQTVRFEDRPHIAFGRVSIETVRDKPRRQTHLIARWTALADFCEAITLERAITVSDKLTMLSPSYLDYSMGRLIDDCEAQHTVEGYLESRWSQRDGKPWLKFQLRRYDQSPLREAYEPFQQMQEMQEAMRDQIMRSFGIPPHLAGS